MLAQPGEQLVAPGPGEDDAGRVLVGGGEDDAVDARGGERVDAEPVLVDGDRHRLEPGAGEDRVRLRVARVLEREPRAPVAASVWPRIPSPWV